MLSKRPFFFHFLLMTALLFTGGCATVDYVGDTYAPTQHVDSYFDKADITRPHKVMGIMNIEESEFSDTSEMQADMLKEAMARGADAVLFTGLQKIQKGMTSNWQDYGKTKGKHGFDYGTTQSTIQSNKEVTGSLIKYTDVQAPPVNSEIPKA